MSRKKSEPPRQNAQQFESSDSAAKTTGGKKSVEPVKECPLQWKLKVEVKGEVNARKPKLEGVEVEIDWNDTSLEALSAKPAADDKSATEQIEGKGNRSGKCRATAKGWYLVAEEQIQLADGDDKTAKLRMKPAVWVGFKGVDEKSGALIEGLKVKADFTEVGEQEEDTPKDKPLELENEHLRPGGTCKVLQISHPSLLLEAVGDVTSA